jgi:hypothetical protein
MFRNLIGTMTKGVVLGAIVVGAKKLYDKQNTHAMKEPLEPEVTTYDGSTATFRDDVHASSMDEVLYEEELIDDDIDYKETPSSTKP